MKTNYESPETAVLRLESGSVPLCFSGGAAKAPRHDTAGSPSEEDY